MDIQDITSWLSSVKPVLAMYAGVFKENGYDTSEDLEGADADEIDALVAKLDGILRPVERALRRAMARITPPVTIEKSKDGGDTEVSLSEGSGFGESDLTSFSGETLMDSFGRLLIDEVPIPLRALIKLLWEARYNEPWVDGPECGDAMMFGPPIFDVDLGEGKIYPGSDAISMVGRDLRFIYQGEGGLNDSLWPGSRLMLNGCVLWMRAGEKVTFKHGTSKFKLREKLDIPEGSQGVESSFPLHGRSRVLYDRQTKPRTPGSSREMQDMLRRGVPNEWDVTMATWVLMNSAHDGQGDPAAMAMGLTYGLQAGVHADVGAGMGASADAVTSPLMRFAGAATRG